MSQKLINLCEFLDSLKVALYNHKDILDNFVAKTNNHYYDYKIYFKKVTGEIITIGYNDGDSVLDIKKKVREKIKKRFENFLLSFSDYPNFFKNDSNILTSLYHYLTGSISPKVYGKPIAKYNQYILSIHVFTSKGDVFFEVIEKTITTKDLKDLLRQKKFPKNVLELKEAIYDEFGIDKKKRGILTLDYNLLKDNYKFEKEDINKKITLLFL